jgi:hypothetical protein
MSAFRRFVLVVSSAAMLGLPALSAAQTRGTALPLAVGQKVSITTADGGVTKGTVGRVTPASIVLTTAGGEVSLAAADITKIKVSDSVWDGAAKGAVSLGVLPTLVAAFSCQHGGFIGPCRDGSLGNERSIKPILAVAVGTFGLGALIGAGLDAVKTKTIYDRKTARPSVALRPIVSAAGKGLGVQVRW